MQSFPVGQTIRVGNHSEAESALREAGDDPADNAFKDPDGVPTDPTEVVIRIEKPTTTGLVTTVYRWPGPGVGESLATKEVLVPAEAGHFFVDVVPVTGEGGVWHWSLESEDTIVAARSGAFFVKDRRPG